LPLGYPNPPKIQSGQAPPAISRLLAAVKISEQEQKSAEDEVAFRGATPFTH